MMIRFGGNEITGVEVYSERAWHEGAMRPTLRLALPGGITAAQLSALTAGEIRVLDEGGNELGVWADYKTLVRHEIVIAQVASLEQMQTERDAALHEASHAQAETAQVRAAAADIVPLMADSAALINAALPLLADWQPAAYQAGDVRQYQGAPYKCVQAHDATGNPDWTPDAVPALWMQYHGTSRETARPWVAPTGAHDMYHAGEWMIWTDGAVYECLSDTAYTPEQYGQAWREAEA